MNSSNKYFYYKMMVSIIFLLFTMPFIISPLYIINYDNKTLNNEFMNLSQQQTNTFSDLESDQLPIKTFSRSSQILNHMIIHKNIIRNITEDLIVGNLTVRDQAILNIKDCNFEIRGKLTVMDNAQIFIKNSNVSVVPGEVGLHERIINFSNNANIWIEDSQWFTFPQPTHTNISYLLSDDNANVTIINSYLNFKLPAVLHLDVSLSPANAGTFVITGESIWDIRDSKIQGYLLIENNALLRRWFIFTLLRSAQFIMKDSTGFVNDNSQPFIKPVAGFVSIVNCRIPHGVIDVEVVAEFEAINLTINDINFRDQTKNTLTSSTILNTLDLGGIALNPIGTGATTDEPEKLEKPKTKLVIKDTYIGNTYIAQGNSSSTLTNCEMDRCSLFTEAFVYWRNSEIHNLIDATGNCTLQIEDTTLTGLSMSDNCEVYFDQNPSIFTINKITTGFNCQGKLSFSTTTVNKLEIFGGDKVLPEEYGPGYDPDLNISRITIDMDDTKIGQLKIEDDAELFLELKNSEINEFSFKKFKEELVFISILDLGSNYTIPDPWPDIDLQFEIFHRTNIKTQVNGEDVEALITVTNNEGELVISKLTNKQGIADLELLYEKYSKNGLEAGNEYLLNLTYLGLSKDIETTAKINEIFTINWEDNDPPIVDDIDIDTSFQSTNRGSRIRAMILDSDIKVIANATIYFQYRTESGWSTWNHKTMIEIENNTFEVEIKQLPQGTKVRFFIIAYDVLGNRGKSEKYTYEIPNTEVIFFYTVVFLLIVILLLIIVFFITRRTKLKKYLKNRPDSESRVEDTMKKDNR